MAKKKHAPHPSNSGKWAPTVLKNMSSLWDFDVLVLDSNNAIPLAYGEWESLAAKADTLRPGKNLGKVAKDVFGCHFCLDSDDAKRFFVDFSRATLRPKRYFPALAEICFDSVKGALAGDLIKASAMEFTQQILLRHNSPEKLMPILLNHYVKSFGADHGLLVIAEEGAESIETYLGDNQGHKYGFLELAGHPAINAQIKTLTNHMFREEFSFSVGDEGECTIAELCVGVLTDMNKPLGYLFLGNERAGGLSGEHERELDRACMEIMSFYKASRLHQAREMRFIQMNDELEHFKETRDVQEMDFRDLEYRWQELMGAHRRLTQIFRIVERLRDCPKDMTYLTRFLEYMKNLCGSATATLCFGQLNGMYLIYQHHERPIQTLFFSELDGGIYHDMVDRSTALFWDGQQQRPFFLPSGHPRVRNCVCLPLNVDGQVVGSAMVANQVERDLIQSEVPVLEKLTSFVTADLCESFEAAKDEFS